MRTIPAPELAKWTEGEESVRELRVRVKRPGEVSWTNLSDTLGGDWVLGVRTAGETPDQPATGFALTFLKHTTEGSLSPGLADAAINKDAALVYRPLLYPGRDVEVDARIDAEPWRLWLQGQIEDVEWSGPQVVASCLTLDAVLLATQIEDTTTVHGAPDPGVAVEVEIQDVATDEALNPPTLLVVGTPDWGVGEYTRSGSVGSQTLEHAQENGWDLRYKWSEADSNFRWTLYLPPRDKTVADFALGLELMNEVPELKVSRQWVRPRIVVRYNDSTTGQIEEVVVKDDALVTEYGKQALIIEELAPGSPIRTSAQATALGEYALADLGQPLADARYRIPFLPWLELHDLLALQADDDRWDFDTDFAIVGLSHVVDPVEGWWTEVLLRGGAPAGAFYTWHARSGRQQMEEAEQIIDQKIGRTEVEVTLQGTPGSRVAEVWAFEELVEQPFDPEEWPDPAVDSPVAMYTAATFAASGHSAAIPSENQVRLILLVTKDAVGNNLWEWPYPAYPTTPDPAIVDLSVINQLLQVLGNNPGARSIRVKHRDGDWESHYDGSGNTFNIANPDPEAHAGISGSDIWTMDVDVYGVPKADVTVGVTPSASRSITVLGPGITPGSQLEWEVVLASTPANLSSIMPIRLRASSGVTTETAKLYAKSNFGTGWSAEVEITGDVSPALTTAPSTNTDYTWDCGVERVDSDPRPRTVTFQIRAELIDGTDVIDNDWDEIPFITGP